MDQSDRSDLHRPPTAAEHGRLHRARHSHYSSSSDPGGSAIRRVEFGRIDPQRRPAALLTSEEPRPRASSSRPRRVPSARPAHAASRAARPRHHRGLGRREPVPDRNQAGPGTAGLTRTNSGEHPTEGQSRARTRSWARTGRGPEAGRGPGRGDSVAAVQAAADQRPKANRHPETAQRPCAPDGPETRKLLISGSPMMMPSTHHLRGPDQGSRGSHVSPPGVRPPQCTPASRTPASVPARLSTRAR